jgi:uncharacterized protein YebE (UPF0316 family)
MELLQSLYDSELFGYVILPLLIFFARITDVTISTLRIVYVMSGKKGLSVALGFVEQIIWLLAIGQIIQNVDNVFSYIAFAGGFSAGTYIGMILEEKIAVGRAVVRIITRTDIDDLIDYLSKHHYRYSIVRGKSNEGRVNILFTVVRRKKLKNLIAIIKLYAPTAFYTIEGVKRVSDEEGGSPKRVDLEDLMKMRKR